MYDCRSLHASRTICDPASPRHSNTNANARTRLQPQGTRKQDLTPPRAHADKLGIQRTSRVMMTEWPSAANCRLADRLDFFGEYENMIPPRRLLWMGRDVSGHGIYVMVAPTRAMWRKDKSTVWRVVHSESPAPALHNMLRDNVYREQCAVCLLCP